MMKRKIKMKHWRNFALAAALAMTSVETAQAESVLKIRDSGDIVQIDPLFSTAYPARDMAYLIWDTLFSMDGDLVPQPQMVGDYSISDDKLVYEFKLRDAQVFHDGAPVTSVDVIASINRWFKKDSLGGEIQKRLASLEAINENSFRITLTEPFGQVLNGLGRMTAYPLFIMPERIANTPIGELTEWVGSGPFQLVEDEWIPGVKFVVEKNDAYVPRTEAADNLAGGKTPGVDRIERIVFPDNVSAANALIAGEIDYMSAAPTEFFSLMADAGIVTKQLPLPGASVQIVLNHTIPPFDNIKIRQAFQYAINQTEILTALYGDADVWQTCPAIFMCGSPYETDVNSERYMNQDFDKARALLEEAGYDGTEVAYMHPTNGRLWNEGGTVIIAALREAGFNVRDDIMESSTLFSRRNNKGPVSEGGWNAFHTAFNGDAMQDPLTNPYVTGACEDAFVGWPCDDQLQANWQEFLAASSAEERKAASVKIQDRANEIVTFITGGQFGYTSAWSPKVSGVVEGNVLVYWNITKED